MRSVSAVGIQGERNPQRFARHSALGVVFLAAYVLAAHLGLLLAAEFGGLTPLWPASGVGLVLLLKLGSGWWPLIVAGEVFTGWSLGQPLTMGLAGGMAQTLEALLGVWLLRRAGIVECFRNLSETIHYSIVVCLIPPLLSAGVGTFAQFAHGLVTLADWRVAWFTWWLGDALGLLIVAPALLVWWRWPFRDARTAPRWDGFVSRGCWLSSVWH